MEQNEAVDYTDVAAAREYFKMDRYATATSGMEIIAVDKGYAKCMLKVDERHLNAKDTVMGGAIFTLADFAYAVAANFRRADHPTVTAVSQICFLSTPAGDTLYAETRLIKDGRRNAFYEISVTDNTGREIALVTTTGCHLS